MGKNISETEEVCKPDSGEKVQFSSLIRRLKSLTFICAFLSGLLTLFILCVIFYRFSIAPFGEYSLACMDADIQYLDFFAYFKRILQGEGSILGFEFSSYLGSNTFGTYAYYLASPFSLLVIFFPQDQLLNFFDIVIVCKMITASSTMAVFLSKRFSISTKSIPFCIALATSYGLSQWMFAQASNIMWLDAAYLLPLVLLGIWRGINCRKWMLFSVAVALSLSFNWYMGAVNCLFSVFWFIFEVALFLANSFTRAMPILKVCVRLFLNYAVAALIGVALSAIMIIPVLVSMTGSSRGTIDPNTVLNFEWVREMPNLVQSYTIGGLSSSDSCSLYAGSLVIIGLLGALFTNVLPCRQRVILGIMMGVLMIMLCWSPFVSLFSLMKPATSYWVRYSYLAIAGIVTCSGFFLLQDSILSQKSIWRKVAVPVLCFVALQFLLDYAVPEMTTGHMTLFSLLAFISLGVAALYCSRLLVKDTKIIAAAVVLIAVVDLGLNGCYLTKIYRMQNVENYTNYTELHSSMISEIESIDDSDYRVVSLDRRDPVNVAHQNESLAYGYASISGYSSVANTQQLDFMTRIGHMSWADCITPQQEIVLPADSLLGVKYVISENAIPGIPMEDVVLEGSYDACNGSHSTTLYSNPYAFPIAFKMSEESSKLLREYSGNPFTYTNDLYKAILGWNQDIYQETPYVQMLENPDDDTVSFNVDIPDGSYVVYGYLPWNNSEEGVLGISGKKEIPYAGFLSRSVFSIPIEKGESKAMIQFESNSINVGSPQFYTVNLDLMSRSHEIAQSRAAEIANFDNERMIINVEGGFDEALFVSLPFDKRWSIEVNGQKVNAKKIADCLMIIPLFEGRNHIELFYEPLNFIPGFVISALALFAIICRLLYGSKRKVRIAHVGACTEDG